MVFTQNGAEEEMVSVAQEIMVSAGPVTLEYLKGVQAKLWTRLRNHLTRTDQDSWGDPATPAPPTQRESLHRGQRAEVTGISKARQLGPKRRGHCRFYLQLWANTSQNRGRRSWMLDSRPLRFASWSVLGELSKLNQDKRFKGAFQECEVFFRGTETVILSQWGWG